MFLFLAIPICVFLFLFAPKAIILVYSSKYLQSIDILRLLSLAIPFMFLNHLYGGMDEPELKIIDVFICKLRRKIADATGEEGYIETVWGRGYVLRARAPAFEHAGNPNLLVHIVFLPVCPSVHLPFCRGSVGAREFISA